MVPRREAWVGASRHFFFSTLSTESKRSAIPSPRLGITVVCAWSDAMRYDNGVKKAIIIYTTVNRLYRFVRSNSRLYRLNFLNNLSRMLTHSGPRLVVPCAGGRRAKLATIASREELDVFCQLGTPANDRITTGAAGTPVLCSLLSLSVKLHYTNTGYGHVVQHHQRLSSQQFYNLLYNKFAKSQCQSPTSRHAKMLGCGKFLSVGGEFVVPQVVELL